MAYSILETLKRDGNLVLHMDFTQGTCYDFSGNGNHGTPSAGCLWNGGGIAFPAATDEVTVADHASLRLTTGTLFVAGAFREPNAGENHALISKRDATPTSNYNFRALPGQLSCYCRTGGGVVTAPTCNTTIGGRKSLAMSFETGAIPVGYADGLSLGNFSGIVTMEAANQPVEIGNVLNFYPTRSTLHHAIICNRALTATEIAILHGELA